jgi:hypothetical protein
MVPRSVRLALLQDSFDLGEVSFWRDGQGDEVQLGTETLTGRERQTGAYELFHASVSYETGSNAMGWQDPKPT